MKEPLPGFSLIQGFVGRAVLRTVQEDTRDQTRLGRSCATEPMFKHRTTPLPVDLPCFT